MGLCHSTKCPEEQTMIWDSCIMVLAQDNRSNMFDCWTPTSAWFQSSLHSANSSESHSSSVQVVSATLLPAAYNSHHWLFLPKEEKSPERRHWISSSFCIIYQVHPDPWVKTIPQLLAFSEVRNNPHCLSQSLTTGALYSPRVCRGSVLPGLG